MRTSDLQPPLSAWPPEPNPAPLGHSTRPPPSGSPRPTPSSSSGRLGGSPRLQGEGHLVSGGGVQLELALPRAREPQRLCPRQLLLQLDQRDAENLARAQPRGGASAGPASHRERHDSSGHGPQAQDPPNPGAVTDLPPAAAAPRGSVTGPTVPLLAPAPQTCLRECLRAPHPPERVPLRVLLSIGGLSRA